MQQNPNILIVDDDNEIRNLLSDLLPRYGFNTLAAANAKEMFAQLETQTVNLILLDIMLHAEDGISLCQQIRSRSNIPIIMISAMGTANDRVLGLEVGADDYIAKPFYPREVVARIKSVLRRHSHVAVTEEIQQNRNVIRFNDWTLYVDSRRLFDSANIEISLSASEFALLISLIEKPNRVLSRDQLLASLHAYSEEEVFDRSVDVLVCRLRKHLESNAKAPALIKTVRGGGYLFNAKVEKVATCS